MRPPTMPHKPTDPLADSKDADPCGVQDAARDARGRWRPGVSGNPAGSKPGNGTRPRLVDVARRTADAEGWDLEQALGAVVVAMLRKAALGDVDAARLVLSRLAVDELAPEALAPPAGPPIPSGDALVKYLDELADLLEKDADPVATSGARAMTASTKHLRALR